MTIKAQTPVQVIDRLVTLLETIAEHDDPLSLKRLAAETGLHPSTSFRILASLHEHGFVERDDAGHYRLGIKLLQLGSRVQGRLDIRREAQPIMSWLCHEIDESVNLIVREDDEVVYVERATPHRMMRVEQAIGGHMPLHVTAVGKLFLAEAGAEACLEYAERTRLKPLTPHSLTDSAILWRNVKEAMQHGFALDNQEAELGVGCIGVPVRDSNSRMVAGISVSAPIERRSDSWIEIVKKAGEELSARLGFHPKNQ
jgi:DNA-binding IclR family transcriptional regulator